MPLTPHTDTHPGVRDQSQEAISPNVDKLQGPDGKNIRSGNISGRSQSAVDRLPSHKDLEQHPNPEAERFWTSTRVWELRGYKAAGLTHQQIANMVGTTRAAICGKVKRMIEQGLISPVNPYFTRLTKEEVLHRHSVVRVSPTLEEASRVIGISYEGLRSFLRKYPLEETEQ